MRPILFTIGNFSVPSFWVMAFLGFLAGFLVVRSEAKRRGLGTELAYDVLLYAYVGGWVGARLFLIPTAWEFFRSDPIAFLLSGSGWVWYGGVAGGTIAVWLLGRRERLPFILLADICAPALALGLAIGRLGCQLSGDGDYGVPTSLPWGMSYPNGVVPTTERVHPAPLYEMIGSTVIFAHLWSKRFGARPGELLGRYLILASSLRFAIEFVRRNPAWLWGLTTAQAWSIALAIVGILVLLFRPAPRPLPPIEQSPT
ncbi:MAG: prolipoprotein diacylglyceryl transferase [Candidatus Binatia bacterium]|nr:MAG: prolipoprotein diacylglyceryl transferase [Candidatus Binatia bacterium]